MALGYVDAVYALSCNLPEREKFNLSSQIERAATSIVLNISEGSTGQSDAEQNRFLGLAPSVIPGNDRLLGHHRTPPIHSKRIYGLFTRTRLSIIHQTFSIS